MKFLVADDHELIRRGINHALLELDPSAEIHDSADAAQTLQAIDADQPYDLILLDLFMPGATGFDLLHSIREASPSSLVVVLSASENPEHMRQSLDAGAAGYIPKSVGLGRMKAALQLVLAGGVYTPADLIPGGAIAGADEIVSRDTELFFPSITRRQREVLVLLGEGKSNKEIAQQLTLSENTIKIHVAALLKALKVDNRTKAAIVAKKRGLI